MTRALLTPLVQASAKVAGVCDAMEHLEIEEVEVMMKEALAFAQAAVKAWCMHATVTELAAAIDQYLADRRRACADSDPSSRWPAKLETWEHLRTLVAWSDGLTDADFMGRDRPSQLRHLSYSFSKLTAKAAFVAPEAEKKLAFQCALLAIRTATVCRKRFDDSPLSAPPSLRG